MKKILLDGLEWNRDKLAERCKEFIEAHDNENKLEDSQQCINKVLESFVKLQIYLKYGE